jgi:hypothetical protein
MTSLLAYSQLLTASKSQRITSYDVLCTDCQSIFDKAAISALQDRSREHVISPRRLHLTFGALMNSVERDCHLCNLIFGCLQDSILYARTNNKRSDPEGIDLQVDKIQLFITLSSTCLTISGDHPDKSSMLWGSLDITPVVCTLVTTFRAELT